MPIEDEMTCRYFMEAINTDQDAVVIPLLTAQREVKALEETWVRKQDGQYVGTIAEALLHLENASAALAAMKGAITKELEAVNG